MLLLQVRAADGARRAAHRREAQGPNARRPPALAARRRRGGRQRYVTCLPACLPACLSALAVSVCRCDVPVLPAPVLCCCAVAVCLLSCLPIHSPKDLTATATKLRMCFLRVCVLDFWGEHRRSCRSDRGASAAAAPALDGSLLRPAPAPGGAENDPPFCLNIEETPFVEPIGTLKNDQFIQTGSGRTIRRA